MEQDAKKLAKMNQEKNVRTLCKSIVSRVKEMGLQHYDQGINYHYKYYTTLVY